MQVQTFNHEEFISKVLIACRDAKSILDSERSTHYPSDRPHNWQDSFFVAESLTNVLVSYQIKVLETLGLSEGNLAQLLKLNSSQHLTLSFHGNQVCKFVRMVERQVESDTKYVTKSTLTGTSTSYTITKIKEFFWNKTVECRITIHPGTRVQDSLILTTISKTEEIKTTTEKPPHPEHSILNPKDVNISWLIGHLDEKYNARFTIDRSATSCQTPRRNEPIAAAWSYTARFVSWLAQVESEMKLRKLISSNAKLKEIEETSIGEYMKEAAQKNSLLLLPPLLADYGRSLSECLSFFPEHADKLLASLTHARVLCLHWFAGLNLLEKDLADRITAAIGRSVMPWDVPLYMHYRSKFIFPPEFQPRPFSYSVRRANHTPEGVVSIESKTPVSSFAEPIKTFSRRLSSHQQPVTFALGSSAQVVLHAERYLHGWMHCKFDTVAEQLQLSLVARARQFSSFILLAGRITGMNSFEPLCGLIVRNKDQVRIPLELFMVPNAKEFREAVESLSPEQLRFAKAIRSMQMESTLFGVCIIQIKPQLERLLNLPARSLTKELQLSQELLSLFIEYNIPSDLLSCEASGRMDETVNEKIDRVRTHAASVRAMIDDAKKEQQRIAAEEQALRLAQIDVVAAPEPALAKALPGMKSLPPLVDTKPMKEGMMEANSKKRYCVLDGSTLSLFKKLSDKQPHQVFSLKGSLVSRQKAVNKFSVLLSTGEEIVFMAATRNDYASWISAFRAASSYSLIGLPSNVEHKIHVEYDATEGFKGILTEWECMLQSSGVTKEEVRSDVNQCLDVLSFSNKSAVDNNNNSNIISNATTIPSPSSASISSRDLISPPEKDTRIAKSTTSDVDFSNDDGTSIDWTKLPFMIEKALDKFEGGAALHQNIINIGQTWQRQRQATLFSDMKEESLNLDDQDDEYDKVLDLLDALSKSGVLPIEHASLHVIVGVVHCFDRSVMDTVVIENVNPLEQIESAAKLLASAVYQQEM